jgi:hypothetical protein
MKTAYPRVPAGIVTGMAQAGWVELPGHSIAAEAGAPGGMTSRYGVVPGGTCASNSDDAGLAVVDSLGEAELGVDGSSDTAHSTIATVVGTIPPPACPGLSPSVGWSAVDRMTTRPTATAPASASIMDSR